MIYEDGVPMDNDLKMARCPKCGNEQFSEAAEFCRICGTYRYNLCEGDDIYDSYGNFDHHEQHRNAGNARFCEVCGKPTLFFKEGFLCPFENVNWPYSVQQILSLKSTVTETEENINYERNFDNLEIPF